MQADKVHRYKQKLGIWVLYVIETNRDNYYYVGISCRIEGRIHDHSRGKVWFTKVYGVKTVDFVDGFDTQKAAEMSERRLIREMRKAGICVGGLTSRHVKLRRHGKHAW